MYRSAARANSGLLKRINKHAPCVYKLVIPRREPLSSKGVNAAHRTFGLKGPGFSTGYSLKRVHPLDTPSLLVQWQRKWLARSSFPVKDGVNNAAATRLARMFSDKTNDKENTEKQNNSSVKPGQKQNAEETGCTLKKPSIKGLSEGHAPTKNNDSCEGDSAQKHEYPNVKRTVLDKRKRESSKSTANKCRIRKSERKKTSTETSSTKNIEEFDRLQLIKGKLIRKLRKKWTSWQNIRESLDNFPYYLNGNTKDLLLDCVAARVKKHEFSVFGESLPCTSHLILLQGQPGTELYQEALVRAIARELRVSLLVVDSNTLSAKDLKDDTHIAGLPVEENKLDKDENSLDAENKESRQTFSLAKVNQMLGSQVKILDLKNPKKKFDIPWKVLRFSTKEDRQEMSKPVQVNNENWENELKNFLVTGREDQLKKLGKKGEELKRLWHDLIIGDHVRYKGPKATKAKTREKARIGQEGFVSSISDSLPWKVCVTFQGGAEEVFCDAAELEKVISSASDEAWLARYPELPIEALCKMAVYCGPVIVHFPDIQDWFSNVPPNGQALFLKNVKDFLSKVDGPVVFIASSFKEETSVQLPAITGLDSLLDSLILEAAKSSHSKVDGILKETLKIFKNVIGVLPPEEPHLLRVWQNELKENKKKVKRERSLTLLEESLEKNCMKCAEMRGVNTFDMQLTSESADDVVGWARNMIYHSKQLQTSEGRLMIEKRCLERSLVRLKDLKFANEDKISHIAGLAENEYEKSLVSSVMSAHDIGVRFDEVGALEDVKSTLKELIVLPMKRPELFKKGNLRKPCKGVLLFGPPGTGKTLVAKAVATEAGASFINITASSLTSKYYGDDEKLVKALFAFARKLSPAVIFLDEVDSLLGARGGSSEHEATRRIKNEIMAAWDGLQTKESEQILVFATTNRPFDLDDAVIRRLPRRILIDLPNAENRAKILRIILANEDLDRTFSFESLALQTEGYSGSDLKNLCVTAAYVPIRELLEAEAQQASDVSGCRPLQSVRPLCMNDFLQAKAKIGASLAYDAAAMVQIRQWNEQYGEGGSRWQKRIGFSH